MVRKTSMAPTAISPISSPDVSPCASSGHITLWAVTDDPRLPAKARAWIADPDNEIVISAASIQEIAIKHSLGRGDMPISGESAGNLRSGRLQLAGHLSPSCRARGAAARNPSGSVRPHPGSPSDDRAFAADQPRRPDRAVRAGSRAGLSPPDAFRRRSSLIPADSSHPRRRWGGGSPCSPRFWRG